MVKLSNVILLSLLLATLAFAKGPEQVFSTATSNGFVDPLISVWGSDIVTWTEVGTAPTVFGRSGGGILGNYMYTFGSEAVNVAMAFNLTTERWEASTLPPQERDNWASATTTDAIYLIGGYTGATAINNVQKFVPTGGGPTGTWTQMAPYPEVNYGPTAAWDGINTIYAAGGNLMTGMVYTAYKYDIPTNTWTAIANLPVTMSFSGSAFLNGKFHCFGGTDAAGGGVRHYAYDPASNTWTQMAAVPQAVWFATSSTTFNMTNMFSVGGGGGYASWPATNAVQIYDPATNSWSQDTPLPVARGCNLARYTLPDKVISGGGYAGGYSGVTYKGIGFPGADPLAPAAPTNFVVANNGAALMASLSWTNPTTTVNGQPLTTITSIVVKRNAVQIVTLSGTPGQAMNYNDNVPSAGMYSYQIYCTNSYGDGLSASGGAWIGLDTPGGVTGLTGAGVGVNLIAELNWTNPTVGAHGGYWPPLSITGYTINRYGPNTATFTLTGIYTTFTDNTVPVQGWYHYGVIASNGSGSGPEIMTPNFFVGPPEFEAIPYNWVEINGVGTNSGITLDDQNLGPFPMGFNFNHYGTTFNSLRVCSNGWISFTSTATTWTNAPIPNAADPNNLIAPMWDDLNPSLGGIIYYYFDSANSRFVVEWDNVMSYTSPNTPQKFEAIFYPNGDIDLMYHTVQAPCVNANTVGKENATGTVGVQVTYNGSGPLEPASSTGIRIFGQPPVIPNVTVTLLPVNPPIIIPPTGGPFDWDITLHNGEATPQVIDIWNIIQGPPTRPGWGPVLDLTIPAGATINRVRTQYVSDRFPAGAYTYVSNIGDYPSVVWDSDSFPFTKSAVGADGWASSQSTAGLIPTEYALHGATPNPFNPTTILGFDLPQAGQVKLTVYNVSGQEVATLVNGWRDAGIHEVTFEATGLASGLYVYQLTAGDFHAIGKMVLMK